MKGPGGLSLGDFIAVAGLIIALLGPLSIALYKTRKKMYAIASDLDAAKRETTQVLTVLRMMSTSHARGLTATNTCFDAVTGVIHRVLLDRVDEVDVDQEVRQLRLMRRGVERAAAEARLMGEGDRIVLRSALQQLTFQLGDARTVEFCDGLAKSGGTRTIPAADLEAAAREMTMRLSR